MNVAGRDPWQCYSQDIPTCPDGSGGVFSSDPRVRSVGWALAQMIDIPEDNFRPLHERDACGQHGTMTGPQTVPRSEAMALRKYIAFLLMAEVHAWHV